MSYKFQSGAATLGGSISATALSGAISADSMSDGVNAILTAGSALTKTFSDVGDSVTLDVAVDDSSIEVNSDALRVKAAGVTNAMLSGAIADGKLASDYVQTSEVDDASIEWSGTALQVKALGITNAMLSGAIADGKLVQDYIQTSEVDDSSIEWSGTALQVKALGVTNAMLSGSIANAKLANSTISGKALGASLDALSQGAGIAAFSYDGSASGVTVALSASVAGDGLAFAAGVLSVGVDDSSIELSGDAVQVKAAGVTNAMLSGAIADSKLLQIVTSDKVAGSAVQLETNGGIADNTGLGLVLRSNDGLQLTSGELALKFDSTSFAVTSVGGLELSSSVAGAGISLNAGVLSAQQTVQATGDADYTAIFGLNVNNANYTQARTVTLPSAGAGDAGKSIVIKARNADQYALTVQRAGSDTIDGSLTSVDIESQSGALTLMCAGAGSWVIV